jgi:hypothetical protein
MVKKPKAVEVLCSIFFGQLVGSHFLSEKGLLKREPDPKDWDVVVPQRFFSLCCDYLLQNGWLRATELRKSRYGEKMIDLDTFEKKGILIDLFPAKGEEKITIANALEHKRGLSKQSSSDVPEKVIEKHLKDFFECLASLGG